MATEQQIMQPENDERGGIKLALLAWLLGVPGLIAAALLLL